MTPTPNTSCTNTTKTVSATLTILTKSLRPYDPDERWTAQKIKDELVLNPPNGVKGK